MKYKILDKKKCERKNLREKIVDKNVEKFKKNIKNNYYFEHKLPQNKLNNK